MSKLYRVKYDVAAMLLVGAHYGAAEGVALLAAVAEETKGDLNSLWRTYFTQDGGTVQRPPESYRTEAVATGSQHAALVSLHRSLSSGPEEARAELATEIDLRVWDGVGRFAKRVGPRLSKHSPSAPVGALWPFSVLLPKSEISRAGLGVWAAVFASSLPRCLSISRGLGSLVHERGAVGASSASRSVGAFSASRSVGATVGPAGRRPRKFALPEGLSGEATIGDVAVCARLSLNHGGAGGKPMPPQAEFATVVKASPEASAAFSALLAARAGL
jgi:hypothetical protein